MVGVMGPRSYGQFLRWGVGGMIQTTTNHIFPLLLGRVIDITVSGMGKLVYRKSRPVADLVVDPCMCEQPWWARRPQ
jgi:hypothetical protein